MMISVVSLAVCLLVASHSQVVLGSGWCYSGSCGPANWASEGNPTCAGTSQSPIDVPSSAGSGGHGQINFAGWDNAPPSMTLTNNGHTAQVDCEYDATISGGGLPGTYKVKQFHFHWGSSNSQGSEHTVDGTAFPLEMHIVMFNTAHGDFNSAAGQAQGLAVLSVLFEAGGNLPSAFDGVISGLGSVGTPGTTTSLSPFPLSGLLPDTSSFKRYDGSLTTPGCNEVVVWTIFDNKLSISDGQIGAFRGLTDSHGNQLVNNFRPTQSLNGRQVTSA